MTYVDGFVIPVYKKSLPEYRKMATLGGKLWKKHGALEYFECVGDDLRVKKGGGQGFVKLAKLKPGKEVVVFSFIVFKSRAHRDEVNKKVMSDPGMKPMEKWMNKMDQILDTKRFSYGGFKVMVEK